MVRRRFPRLFYSYSKKDQRFRDELETHLSLLRWQGLLQTWDFRELGAGELWDERIKEELDEADLIVLLVSANFLASKYIWTVEFKRALQRHKEGTPIVIPIIVNYAEWQQTPLKNIQVLPTNGKPIVSWSPRAKGWTDVAQGIRKVLEGSGARVKRSEAPSRGGSMKGRRAAPKAAHSAPSTDAFRKLGREYDRVRAAMAPGTDRTTAMEQVYRRMLKLAATVAAPENKKHRDDVVRQLARADSSGERLAAIAILETSPVAARLRWLAERLRSESPFIGYHAATAILSAVDELPPDAEKNLQAAIDIAFGVLGTSGASTDRAKVLLEAQRLLALKKGKVSAARRPHAAT